MTTTPQWQPPTGPAPTPSVRPWYRKKRVLIPAGLVLLAGIGGALSEPADTAAPAAAPASTSASAATTEPAASSSAPPSASSAPASTAAATPTEETTEPVVDPYTERFDTFTTITQSGTGDSVIPLPAEAEAALVTATHKGSSNFAVQTLDSSNQMDDLLINEIGAYQGSVPFMAGPSLLLITADGAWTIATS